ncbi:MAG TPA: hypothetical protein VF282_11255 [Bacillota bacterium]
MRTTIRLPDALYRELRVRAAETGETLGALIARTLERGLRRDSRRGGVDGGTVDKGRTQDQAAEPVVTYGDPVGSLTPDEDGSIRLSAEVLRRAGLGADLPLSVSIAPGRVLITARYPITDELAGSMPESWSEDPVALQRRLREEAEPSP